MFTGDCDYTTEGWLMLTTLTTILASENGDTVDLRGGWESVWNGLKDGNPAFAGVMNLLTAVGAVIVVMAIAKLLWEKRRGSGGGGGMGGGKTDGIMWALALGAILAAPNLILPVLLTILDSVANGIASVFQNTAQT